LFHRRFPEVSISKSYLQKIYKDNKVKRKAITYTKKKKGLGSEKYEASLLMMRSEVMEALASKKKIIFIDEAMFTYSTNAMLAYAPNRQNICVDEKLSSAPAIAMVAGVSVESGGGARGLADQAALYRQRRLHILHRGTSRSKPIRGDYPIPGQCDHP